MTKALIWHSRSLIKNIKKRKFYSIFRYLWDSGYRRDIDYLSELTAGKKFEANKILLKIGRIQSSHAINYPLWVDHLESKIRVSSRGSSAIEPVTVIWDEWKKRHLIVDGNHRFEALRRVYNPEFSLYVIILEEVQ